jgi:chaperonin cofactor prefoldin
MTSQEDSKSILQRLSVYVQELTRLFKTFDITNPKGLWRALRNREFRTGCHEILIEVAKSEGGKLTLTTISILIGAALGGVGIAALGGAIGIPMAALLAPVGYLAGSKLDSSNWKQKTSEQLPASADSPGVEQPETDLEEMAALLSTLLSRSDIAEANSANLEGRVSELFLCCERNESTTRELESRVVTLEARIANFETIMSGSRSRIDRLHQRMKYLVWIGLTFGAILVLMLVWTLVKR